MQQLLSIWLSLEARARVIVMLSSVAMFAAVIGLARLATAPNMVTLYSGLESSSAGEVVKALEQQGAVFEVRNGSIYVDSQQRDQLRMSMASNGLPATNNQGYELLDDISGFGTTAQMFDAAYWRAKEGELARTIVASPQFQSARVHISNSPGRAFRQPQNPSGSITVTGVGNGITTAQARALRFLVSSAVAGMQPSDVSVIDGRNGTVVQDENQVSGASDAGSLEEKLRSNVLGLLEARVGLGNAVVEVNIETNTESESIVERTFDPDNRVAISIQKEERATSSNGTSGGAVTVASNLPEGDGAASGGESSSQNTETNETTNYEVSETTREIVRTAGSIRRLTIAALVDGVYETDPATNNLVWAPREDSELESLRELISAAVGYDEARGDSISLKSLQFQAPELPEPGIQASFLQSMNLDGMRLLQVFVLGIVSLVIGLFVLRPALASGPVPALAASPDMSQIAAPNNSLGQPLEHRANESPNAITGEITDGGPLPTKLPVIEDNKLAEANAANGSVSENPSDRLREMVTSREDETVEILRNWIDGKGEQV